MNRKTSIFNRTNFREEEDHKKRNIHLFEVENNKGERSRNAICNTNRSGLNENGKSKADE